jgi:hypothetical protein
VDSRESHFDFGWGGIDDWEVMAEHIKQTYGVSSCACSCLLLLVIRKIGGATVCNFYYISMKTAFLWSNHDIYHISIKVSFLALAMWDLT